MDVADDGDAEAVGGARQFGQGDGDALDRRAAEGGRGAVSDGGGGGEGGAGGHRTGQEESAGWGGERREGGGVGWEERGG